MKKLLVAALFTICLGGLAKADLAKRINGIISQPSQKKVQFSIHIVKADTGRSVYSHNAGKTLVPASNMKIITTAAALKYLGPNYEYKTTVGLRDDTLIVMGGGDPLLGDKVTDAKYGRKDGWIFQDIIAKLKRKRIRTVRDIIVDSSIFDDQRVHPNWPKKELNRWYACEVSGLNFNGNCIEITAKNTGGKVAVSVKPKTGFVKLINKVKPISKGSSTVGSYRQKKPNTIEVNGKCRKQAGPFAVAIERPAAFFGFLLAENLAKAGIKANGQLIEKTVGDDRKIRVLAEYNTPIADCLARCNKNSLGLAAEALLKTIGAYGKPGAKNGSWAGGQQLISRYLLALGINRGQFHIDDGSGLSRQNKLSANAITKVLSDVYKSRHWKLYKRSLAVGGVDGTVAKYFKEQQYKGKISAKTGYMSGIRAFSGVCSTEEGDYIFSILAN
ncbi:MAG: D-alanyl-D-alanine carboxypeptidase/D-alanyl-D-alanine endopeptidase, partial [Planctomycetota bacterium]